MIFGKSSDADVLRIRQKHEQRKHRTDNKTKLAKTIYL
jgi:hypothetical protein